jgi:hypothetical protein
MKLVLWALNVLRWIILWNFVCIRQSEKKTTIKIYCGKMRVNMNIIGNIIKFLLCLAQKLLFYGHCIDIMFIFLRFDITFCWCNIFISSQIFRLFNELYYSRLCVFFLSLCETHHSVVQIKKLHILFGISVNKDWFNIGHMAHVGKY